MGWHIEWTVVRGHSGARPDRSPTEIFQGDRVRFVLQLREDYQYALEMAQTERGWQQRPSLQVRGYQDTQVTTQAIENNPLVIEYTFNYEGTKHLHFSGSAREFFDPTQRVPRRDRNGELVREAMFPDLEISRDIQVRPSTSRGEATASTAGRQSAAAHRQQRDMEHRREIADRLDQVQQQQRQQALEKLDEQAQQRRDTALPQRSRRLSSRGVLLGINLLEAHEMSTRRIEEVQLYLARLQSAINVTPALLLYNHPWEDVPNQGYVPRTRFRQQRIAWQVDDNYRIKKVRQYRYKFGASTSRGIDQRPPLQTNITIETIRLQSSDWLVVKFSRNGAKSLIPVQAAIESIRTEQLIELASAMVTLISIAMAAATSPQSLAFEILANTLLPDEVNTAIGVASISVSVVRGLARILSRVIQHTGTLSAANAELLHRLARTRRQAAHAPHLEHAGNPRGTGGAHITDSQRGLPEPTRTSRTEIPERASAPTRPTSTSTAIVRRIDDISQAPFRPHEMRDTGLSHSQVAVLSRLINHPIAEGELTSLGNLWHQAMLDEIRGISTIQNLINNGTPMSVVRRRARGVFGRIRNNFWRRVYADGTWNQTFAASGIRLRSRGRSPFIILNTPNGTRRVTIDMGHEEEFSHYVLQGFNRRNLSLQFQDENRILLNQLMSQDPFQPDARMLHGRGVSRAGRLRYGIPRNMAGTTDSRSEFGILTPPPD